MRIALSVFENRVSPVFDWSNRLLVIERDGAKEMNRTEHSIAGMSPVARADYLAGMNVNTLVCGGISKVLLDMVEARGIRVIPWIAGDMERVLGAFLEGRILSGHFFMPGSCNKQHRHGGGRRRRAGRCNRRNRGPGHTPK